MQVYLDNSATTRPFDEVRECMRKIEDDNYGNPSSMHLLGVNAEKEIRQAKETFAKLLKVQEKEILFTSGGTESDNLALIGAARANCRSGKHLITQVTEHPAILETMRYLESEGYEVTYLPVDKTGRVDPEVLRGALREDTILVSIMHVNNEIGACQDIQGLSSVIKNYRKEILFHVDAVQSFGKYKIYPKRMGIDMLSVSGHKIHGPKGTGILYIDEKVKIHPIIFGGGQQKGMRSGTENVPAIAGIALAAGMIYTDFDEKINRLYELKEYFIKGLLKLPGIYINGLTAAGDEGVARIRETAPHVVSASVDGIRAEVLLHALEDKGIFVSSGSACASNKPAISATLKAIGVKKEYLDSTIRFSFSVHTTEEELKYTLDTLAGLLDMLRKYTRH